MKEYRNIKIESIEGIQMGHKTNRSTLSKVGVGTSRKCKGYIIHWPDGGTSTALDTLKEAKERIDSYLN